MTTTALLLLALGIVATGAGALAINQAHAPSAAYLGATAGVAGIVLLIAAGGVFAFS